LPRTDGGDNLYFRINKYDLNGRHIAEYLDSLTMPSYPIRLSEYGRISAHDLDGSGAMYTVFSYSSEHPMTGMDDSWTTNIRKYGRDGSVIERMSWSRDSARNIFSDKIRDITIDKAGPFLYVTDGTKVYKLSDRGRLIEKLDIRGASSIALGNSIFIADNSSHQISKYDFSGDYLAKWGGSGELNGKFGAGSPSDLAINDATSHSLNKVITCDPGNDRIQIFRKAELGEIPVIRRTTPIGSTTTTITPMPGPVMESKPSGLFDVSEEDFWESGGEHGAEDLPRDPMGAPPTTTTTRPGPMMRFEMRRF
jgi:hypothetical protein